MKVVVVLDSLFTGGAEFSTLSFYGWLSKRGCTVNIVCVKKANPSYELARFGLQEATYLSGKGLLKRFFSLRVSIRKLNPDLVHSVLFQANLLTRFVRVMNPSFVHLESLVNEMYSHHRLQDPRVKRWKLFGYKLIDRITQNFGVDHFHANGTSVAQHYQQNLGIEPHRITIIHRGRALNEFVNDEVNRAHVRQTFASGKRLLLINVGRQEFQKGQDVLLEALSLLGTQLLLVQLLVIGREGNFTSALRAKVNDLHLEANVVLTGHREDVNSLLAAADIFVFPSRFEGLPGALIEAEAAGLPIICSSIPNNLEVVEEGRNALLFRADTPVELAGALQTLIQNPELRQQMGRQSSEIYQQRFSLEGVNQKMELLVLRLMKSREV
jgi:glycosyltransferase involved in cell wall biosynthesis